MKQTAAKTKSTLSDSEKRVVARLRHERTRVFDRFPLLFTFLGTFGIVATIYGFERVIDEIDLFANNPFILLGTGVLTLILTGSLYSRLR